MVVEGQESYYDVNSVIEDLQELLIKNNDAEKGFLTAENASRNLQLKKFLKKQAGQKNQFVDDLAGLLKALSAVPRENGSAAGAVHRAWIDIKSNLTSNKDEAVLKECIRGERESEREYVEKLQKDNLPSGISEILKRHLAQIRITIA